jgi:hypothetical protein
MKFYITVEGIQKLKRSFLNLKLFQIINIPDILQEHGYDFDTIDEYGYFIVAQKIQTLINNYTKSKRIRGIIYCNPRLNEEIIDNIMSILEGNSKISDVVLLDDYNVQKVRHFYHLFPEVIFFPSVKKIRLIECKPIKDKVIWKVPHP